MLQIIEVKIKDSILEYFLNFPKPSPSNLITGTKNGNQTPNIVSLIDPNLILHLKTNYLIPSINKIKGNYNYTDIDIDWVHHITYNLQGKQLVHNHEEFEDFSFILYLNDCPDGHTIFYTFPKPTILTPSKGKLVIFKSHLYHEATQSINLKQVIVGAIQLQEKKWNPRP
jgi:hypothetical protein